MPSGLVARASRPEPSLAGLPGTGSGNRPGATSHYGLLWWNNGDRSLLDVPPDAFWSWGLADSLIIVIRASISSSTLSRGTDTIMASVTDSDAEAGSASLTLIA